MNPVLRLFRPVNGIMAIFGTIISSIIASGLIVLNSYEILITGSICAFLVLSGGNMLNDLLDSETDKINHPERPIPSGKIKKETVKIMFVSSFIIAEVLAFLFLNYYALLVVSFAIILLVLYETKGKYAGLPGNIIVSVLIGMLFIFGGTLFLKIDRTVPMFFLATFSNISRELIKDTEDMKGDMDRNTFPIKHGRKTALNLSTLFIALTVSISFVPYFLKIFSFYYLIPLSICDTLFVLTGIIQYKSEKKGQNLSKLSMIMGLVSFTVGGLT